MAFQIGKTSLTHVATDRTAAHAPDATSVVPVVQVKGSETYRTFFSQVLEKFVFSRPDLVSRTDCLIQSKVMNCLEGRPIETTSSPDFPDDRDASRAGALLTDALSSIKAAAERTLGEAVDIRAMSLPYHWNGTIRRTIFEVASASGFTIKGSRQILKFPHAARVAYNLDTRGDDDHLIILVDYNAAYLHLSIAEVSGDACIVEGQVQLAELGENVLKIDSTVCSIYLSPSPGSEKNVADLIGQSTFKEIALLDRTDEALT